jgi:hypothetical protein
VIFGTRPYIIDAIEGSIEKILLNVDLPPDSLDLNDYLVDATNSSYTYLLVGVVFYTPFDPTGTYGHYEFCYRINNSW